MSVPYTLRSPNFCHQTDLRFAASGYASHQNLYAHTVLRHARGSQFELVQAVATVAHNKGHHPTYVSNLIIYGYSASA